MNSKTINEIKIIEISLKAREDLIKGLNCNSSLSEARQEYLKLAKIYHPDKKEPEEQDVNNLYLQELNPQYSKLKEIGVANYLVIVSREISDLRFRLGLSSESKTTKQNKNSESKQKTEEQIFTPEYLGNFLISLERFTIEYYKNAMFPNTNITEVLESFFFKNHLLKSISKSDNPRCKETMALASDIILSISLEAIGKKQDEYNTRRNPIYSGETFLDDFVPETEKGILSILEGNINSFLSEQKLDLNFTTHFQLYDLFKQSTFANNYPELNTLYDIKSPDFEKAKKIRNFAIECVQSWYEANKVEKFVVKDIEFTEIPALIGNINRGETYLMCIKADLIKFLNESYNSLKSNVKTSERRILEQFFFQNTNYSKLLHNYSNPEDLKLVSRINFTMYTEITDWINANK